MKVRLMRGRLVALLLGLGFVALIELGLRLMPTLEPPPFTLQLAKVEDQHAIKNIDAIIEEAESALTQERATVQRLESQAQIEISHAQGNLMQRDIETQHLREELLTTQALLAQQAQSTQQADAQILNLGYVVAQAQQDNAQAQQQTRMPIWQRVRAHLLMQGRSRHHHKPPGPSTQRAPRSTQ